MPVSTKAVRPSQAGNILKKLAVIGDPISHSLSPLLHSFLIEQFDLPFTYEALHVRAEELPRLVARLREDELAGVNVTLPHKQAIMPLLDELVYPADRIGAVNTVRAHAGKLFGYNTDAEGFQRSLHEANLAVRDQEVFVLGAGGAAKAVVFALLAGGVEVIYLSNRDGERAQRLRANLSPQEQARVRLVVWDERERVLQTRPCAALINATSLGMSATRELSPCSRFRQEMTVVDLIYNPRETLFLQQARQAGATTLNGLPMLIHQGVAAMELWSGKNLKLAEAYKLLAESLMKKLPA